MGWDASVRPVRVRRDAPRRAVTGPPSDAMTAVRRGTCNTSMKAQPQELEIRPWARRETARGADAKNKERNTNRNPIHKM